MDVGRWVQEPLKTPAFIVDSAQVMANLQALASFRRISGCKVLYSIKSLPLMALLQRIKPWVDGFSVSSLFEAKLAKEILADEGGVHLTTPGIRADELDELAVVCSHISLNSLRQYHAYRPVLAGKTSLGLRVNPKWSVADDCRYDPCRRHSKLGVALAEVAAITWPSLDGLHFHTHFAGDNTAPLLATLDRLERHLADRLASLSWLNLGGGYLYNQMSDLQVLAQRVIKLRRDYEVDVIIEPGKAVLEHAAFLVSSVQDLLVSDGKTIAVLDTSVNHYQEVFEYQYRPQLAQHYPGGGYSAILAGSTCLAGDLFGEYRFDRPLKLGDKMVFTNVGAYSLVKANRFNGLNLPTVYLYHGNDRIQVKTYGYSEYRQQLATD